nr:MAG TPA: hypothetical protein [Bacteriophage sp.]
MSEIYKVCSASLYIPRLSPRLFTNLTRICLSTSLLSVEYSIEPSSFTTYFKP